MKISVQGALCINQTCKAIPSETFDVLRKAIPSETFDVLCKAILSETQVFHNSKSVSLYANTHSTYKNHFSIHENQCSSICK